MKKKTVVISTRLFHDVGEVILLVDCFFYCRKVSIFSKDSFLLYKISVPSQ